MRKPVRTATDPVLKKRKQAQAKDQFNREKLNASRDTAIAEVRARKTPSLPKGAVAEGPAVPAYTNATSNARKGQDYTVEKGDGGNWHVYGNKRIFVRKKRNTRQGQGRI